MHVVCSFAYRYRASTSWPLQQRFRKQTWRSATRTRFLQFLWEAKDVTVCCEPEMVICQQYAWRISHWIWCELQDTNNIYTTYDLRFWTRKVVRMLYSGSRHVLPCRWIPTCWRNIITMKTIVHVSSSINASDLYSGDSRLESQLGYRLLWLTAFLFSSVSPGKRLDSTFT
jgi:hypothetical protein